MTFASPLWLIGLLPWAAWALWLLLKRSNVVAVPFLHLWSTHRAAPVRQRRIGIPATSTLFLMLGTLLAVLGAARPCRTLKLGGPVSSPSVHIEKFAAAMPPGKQVMATMRTRQWNSPSVNLIVSSAGQNTSLQTPIGADATKTVFLDLPATGSTIVATVPGDSMTLQRAGNGVVLSDQAHAPNSLRRLVELYRKMHPGDGVALDVGATLPASRLGILLSPPTDAHGPWTVIDDPLTRHVDFQSLSGGTALNSNWQPLVYRDKLVLIARQTEPVKQVMVSIADVNWASEPSFVVFWTNALDWLGNGNGCYSSLPGNQGGVRGEGNSQPSQRSTMRNRSLLRQEQEDLSRPVFLAALGCLLLYQLIRVITYTAAHGQPIKAAHSDR